MVNSGFVSCVSLFCISSTTSLLVRLAFLVKSPMYCLHFWLPKAHVEAPLLGSMLLSGVLLKLGGYGFLLLAPSQGSCSCLYLILTLLGSVVCSILCFRAWDFKCVVAYSSVVHIGLVTLGALTFSELGTSAAIGMLVFHSFISPLLFCLGNEFYVCSSSRCLISGFASSLSKPILCVFLLLISFNFGLPPTLGFFVEIGTFVCLGDRSILFSLLLLCSSFLAFLYNIILYIQGVSGRSGSAKGVVSTFYVYLPGLFFVVVLPLFSYPSLLF